MSEIIEKGIWLSYDLGIGGDYPDLYKWLDNHKAKECGNNVAFFTYPIEKKQLDVLHVIVGKDIEESVELRPGDRLYIIYQELDGKSSRIKGSFICGRRKSNPWEGYGDFEPQGGDDSE